MWLIIYNHIKHINNVQELYIGALLDVTGEVTDEIRQKIHLYFISKFANWRVSSRISAVGEFLHESRQLAKLPLAKKNIGDEQIPRF